MLKEIVKPFYYPKVGSIGSAAFSAGTGKSKAKVRNWKKTLWRVWHYLAESKGRLLFVFFLVLASSAFALLGPFLVGMALDHYIVSRDNQNLIFLLLGLALVYPMQSLTMWLQNIVMIGIAQSTVFKMRTQLFSHLHQLPIAYFDQRQHGELMSRVTNDIENVSSTLNTSFIQMISSVLALVGTLSVMLALSPILMLISLFVVPVMTFGMKWITKRTGRLFKEQQQSLGDLNGYIEETMSGQRVIKAFSLEKKVIGDFKAKNERLKIAGYWAQVYSGFIPKLMNGLNNLNFAIIAGIGGLLAIHHVITIGVIVIFAEYSRQFTRPLNDLANQFNTFLSAVAGAERVFDVLDERKEHQDERRSIQLKEVKGEIRFDRVGFSYDKGGRSQTIKDLSFTVSPGETVAFVGPTGAGKTTVVQLLSRFYDADSGHIYLDGHDITMISRENLRKHMAFVLQDSFLFRGTIRENIRYGNLDADDDEIERAAKLANAHSFIMKLPGGYETILTYGGSGISQGQKQLLSIARAILADPAILILDEATSSIDTVTEIHIQEALQRLMRDRTSVVIAHRLNTVRQVDQILVLHNGQIIEKGTHDELLRQSGFYYNLYHSQLKKGSI